MTVRANLDVQTSISSTTANEKDLGNIRVSTFTDAWGEGGSRKLTVAGSTTDLAVGLCDLADGQFLFLRQKPVGENDPAQTIIVKLNSNTAEAISIAPFGDKKEGFFMLTTTGLTTLYITNSGSVAVEVTLVTAGD